MNTLWPHEPASGVMEIQAAQMTADPTILAGTPYRLLEKIGEGASGEVFDACTEESGSGRETVAPHCGHDAKVRDRSAVWSTLGSMKGGQ